jgi:hypothetical protein
MTESTNYPTTQLEDDGASYRCTFYTFIDAKEWRCPQEAKEAISMEDFNYISKVFKAIPTLHIGGRALCKTHIKVLRRDWSIN